MYVCVCFPDRRPVCGSCRQGLCMCVYVFLTGDLYAGHVGKDCVSRYVCVCFPDRRPVFGSCRQGLCMCVYVFLTGDLYAGHVGKDCVSRYVCVCFPDRRPVFGSCRQGLCMCVVCFPDRQPAFGSCRQGLCMTVYTCMYACVSLNDDTCTYDVAIFAHSIHTYVHYCDSVLSKAVCCVEVSTELSHTG